jgi:hypothetical protein
VNYGHTRQVAEADALLGEREHARDEGLRRDDSRRGREADQGVEETARGQEIEGVRDRLRLREHEGALAEVVEQQGGEREPEPGEADRPAAEMAEVGVERLGAGDSQHHAAQHEKRRPAVLPEELHGVPRIERREDRWVPGDLDGPEHADGDEPNQHDRSEDSADPRGAITLDPEEQEQHHERRGQHVRRKTRGRDLQALGRAQHGDRRGDDPVAVE